MSNWRILVTVVAAAAIVTTASLVSVAREHQAQAAPPTLLEPSQSCANLGVTTSLTLWGSGFAFNSDHTIFSNMLGLGPNGIQAHADQSGNFTLTNVQYHPMPGSPVGANDVLSTDDGTIRRDIRIVAPATPGTPPQPPCPTSTPPTPCVTAGQLVTSSGMLLPFNKPDPGAPTEWQLNYAGVGAGQPAFDHSKIAPDNSASARVPLGTAPGSYLITDISRFTPATGPSPDDIYVTFPITICQPPPPTTTTTHPTTPTTTATTTTTMTGSTTTTTTTSPGGPSPALTLSPAVGPDGTVVMLNGTNFPANTDVVVQWNPGVGSVSVKTGPLGQFTSQLLVLPHDEIGNRQAVAVGFPSAVAPMLVVPSAIEPAGANVAILYHN